VPWWLGLLAGGGLLYGLLRVVGTPIETVAPPFKEEPEPVEA
jgi:hypothetical protein